MIITPEVLATLLTGYKTTFNKGFAGAPSFWQKIAMKVPSASRANTYGWLGSTAAIREWVGPRVVTGLSASGYTIENKKFEATVSVPRDSIEDDTLGVYGPMFEKIGRDTAMFPDEQCFALLAAGFTTSCFDGQSFFDTDHPVGQNGLTDEVSVSNVQAGSGPAWFLIDASQPVKPIIYQERMPFDFQQITAANQEHVFFQDEYVYGVRGRSNVGFGLWQTAYASKDTLNATNYAAARAAMQSFKSDSGKPLGIKPTHLIVPPTLEEAGLGLLNTEVLDGGGSNKWKGTAELIVTPYLG